MDLVTSENNMNWQPPERPDWVKHINAEGDAMDIRGVVPLDEASLLNAAIEATGFSDFGADDWREPFRVFIKSLEDDAALNLMGRLMTRSEILQLLTARLQIEETYKQHPEIANETIKQPIFVVGQGRSGTSFLINLLDEDPNNGAPRHWEMVYPCPPPDTATYLTDPRIEKAHHSIDLWNRVTPTMESMHEFAGWVPMECGPILALNFMSPTHLHCLGQVAQYETWLATHDFMPALRYHRRVLKLLQWKNQRKHWILKDPMHLGRLKMLLELYPDACFIWPHRDPVRALASVINITGTVQWARSDHPFKGESFGYFVDPELSATRLDEAIKELQSGAVPQGQFANVLYTDLVRDPMAAVTKIYETFGIPMTPEGKSGMAAYLQAHPRDNRPAHRFSAGSPESLARSRKAYAYYQNYFGVPSE